MLKKIWYLDPYLSLLGKLVDIYLPAPCLDMTITLQTVPYGYQLTEMAQAAWNNFRIVSPFITAKGADCILASKVPPKIITKVTASNLASKALHAPTLKKLLLLGANIRSIPNLHAKLYLINDSDGMVTSSNLTRPGLLYNVELGIRFTDEPALFASVSSFFELLWERATSVTLESLEELETKINTTKFDKGVWQSNYSSPSSDSDNELQIPTPAIGYLSFSSSLSFENNQQLNQDLELLSNSEIKEYFSENFNEFEDFFAPLPNNTKHLIAGLSSEDKLITQINLNALELTSPYDFNQWLNSLSDEEFQNLVSIDNHYPYKSRVISRIIRYCSVEHLTKTLASLTSNSSNEAQLIKYHDSFLVRVYEFDNDKKFQFIESIVKLAEKILNMIGESTKVKKNYAKPNFDKLIELLQKSGASEENLKQLKSKLSGQEDKNLSCKKKSFIPAFQEIRRKREELGQEFWFYAEEYFSAISSGEWNYHLSSLIALFKELRKIQLSHEQVDKIQILAVNLQVKLDTNAAIIRDELIVEAQEYGKQFQNYLSVKDRQEWNKALDELKPYGSLIIKATGRMMSLYGQWRKANLIPDNQEIKRKLDYLTTYLNMRKILADWIGNR